jgi:hypothetical protein
VIAIICPSQNPSLAHKRTYASWAEIIRKGVGPSL